jgi:hypothetical protein
MITKLIIILTNVDLRDGSTLLILPVENGNTFVHINVNQTHGTAPPFLTQVWVARLAVTPQKLPVSMYICPH